MDKLITFKENVSEDFSTIIEQKMSKDKVQIKEEWKENKMDEICPLIQEWKIKEFRINKNIVPIILKQISHIQFPNLKYFSLIENQIESIEQICKMHIPLLEELFLIDNRIRNVGELAKGNFPHIWRLAIHDNKIQDGQKLTKASFKVRNLSFDMDFHSHEECEDVRWLVKLEGASLKRLWMESSKRIYQKAFQKNLEQLCPQIRVFSKK